MNKKKVMKIIKIVLIILLVIVVLFLVNAIRNFIIVKELKENFKQYTSYNNYHIKATSYETDGTRVILNYYRKDNKEAVILERNKDETISKILMYNNGTRKDVFYDNPQEKKAELNADLIIEVQLYDYFETQTDLQLFGGNMFAQIKKINYNGKECYSLNNSFTPALLSKESNEVYIEKDTGLVVRTNIGSIISEREYEFDTVKDEIFAEPDISQYELIEKN